MIIDTELGEGLGAGPQLKKGLFFHVLEPKYIDFQQKKFNVNLGE